MGGNLGLKDGTTEWKKGTLLNTKAKKLLARAWMFLLIEPDDVPSDLSTIGTGSQWLRVLTNTDRISRPKFQIQSSGCLVKVTAHAFYMRYTYKCSMGKPWPRRPPSLITFMSYFQGFSVRGTREGMSSMLSKETEKTFKRNCFRLICELDV